MSMVEFAVEDEIAIVTINRPEARNAVDQPTAAALADAFRRFDADDALSVAVLTGAGGTFYSTFGMRRSYKFGHNPTRGCGTTGLAALPLTPNGVRLS